MDKEQRIRIYGKSKANIYEKELKLLDKKNPPEPKLLPPKLHSQITGKPFGKNEKFINK